MQYGILQETMEGEIILGSNISMTYDFENKAYIIYYNGTVHKVVYSWVDYIKEFRWLQRKIDKEIE